MAYYNTYAVIEANKDRILCEIERLYAKLERPHISEVARKHIEREIRLYEKEFEAWDTNGFCAI